MILKSPQKHSIQYAPALKKNLLFWSFLAVFLASATTIYFLIARQSTLLKSYQTSQQELSEARSMVQELRQQVDQISASKERDSAVSNKEILGKISDNFQKVFIFSKLEYRILSGKNFSSSFVQLEQLMGDCLRTPEFDILRNNTQGIPLSSDIESSFKAYTPSHGAESATTWEKIVSFLKGFLKIKSFQEKEKMETLCTLIRNDHNKKAMIFIKENLPEYGEWGQALKTRYEAKKALHSLEKIIFESLRI